MARELIIAWTGRQKGGPWEALCADYRRRIERDVRVRDLALRQQTAGDPGRRLHAEAEAIRKRLPERCWLVALDRRGRGLSSLGFADWLNRRVTEWPHAIAFVLGSDIGLAPQLIEQARTRLSLGPLTLPHDLARLVLYEQLYRALSIRNGIKYHRQPLTT
jgi:23S rRNA (pseudouridine1915-N3)-methyltransferase